MRQPTNQSGLDSGGAGTDRLAAFRTIIFVFLVRIMNTEDFISEIMSRPPIWMAKHPHHKFKNVIKRLWEEIKEIFPTYEVEQLKKKWKNLKDAYRKELKKTPQPRSGDPGIEHDISAQWKYFNIMSFLKEEFMPDENDSNLNDQSEDITNDSSSRSEVHLTSSPQSPSDTRPREVSPQPTTSQSSTHSRKRMTPNDIRTEYLEIEKKKLKVLEEEFAKQNQNTRDVEKSEDYHYLMSILPQMEKLNSLQKMRVRNKINQVLMDEMAMNMYGDTTYAPRGYYSQSPSNFSSYDNPV